MTYNWNTNNITNNTELEKVLRAEKAGFFTANDPSNFKKNIVSLHQFQIMYHNYEQYLLSTCPEIYNFTTNLYKYFPYDLTNGYRFSKEHITNDELVGLVIDFFIWLGDPEILDIVKYIMNPSNHLLNIQNYNPNNPICQEIKGRCIKDYHQQTGFISLYRQDTINDFHILVHEIGHLSSIYLFSNNPNYTLINSLSEIEGLFFQFLAFNYLALKLGCIKESLCLYSNKAIDNIDTIWRIKIQDIIAKTPSIFYSTRKINTQLKKIPTSIQVKTKDIPDIIKYPIPNLIYNVNAYLIALKLANTAKSDNGLALEQYRKIFSSTEQTLSQIYENNNIDLNNLSSSLKQEIERCKTLKKTFNS